MINYTIPRNNRELQPGQIARMNHLNYTIPRNNRELQPFTMSKPVLSIIPYQEIIGNYS